MSKQMAIIKDMGIGLRDIGSPCIWFTTYISECSAALQVITGKDQIYEFIKASGAKDISDLEGEPCWVEADNSTIRFLELIKIKGH